jgi:hypothetical protein
MTELSTQTLQQYDVYDIAHLAGGLPRVVDTAVVALLRSGRVRASDGGQLAVVSATRRHPVEAAVLDVIGPWERRSVGSVRWRLDADPRLLAIAERLHAEGLIRSGAPWSRCRRPVARTRAGRRLLRRLRAEPPTDLVAPGTGARTVALHGAERLGDKELYRKVFAPAPRSRTAGTWFAGGDARGTHPYAYGPFGGGADGGGWGGDGGCNGGCDGGGGGGC